MEIKTNFNIGDRVFYDDCREGTVIGIEIIVGINNRQTVSYKIKVNTVHDQVVLINKGDLRNENELCGIM